MPDKPYLCDLGVVRDDGRVVPPQRRPLAALAPVVQLQRRRLHLRRPAVVHVVHALQLRSMLS